LGFQTFHDTWLRFLARTHGCHDNHRAFEDARQAGFANISGDLMFGFPAQTDAEIASDLRVIAGMGLEHVSVYALAIEPQTRFFVDRVPIPDDRISRAQYDAVIDALCAAGFCHDEVSNFSKPGFASAHNKNYWQGGNYLGFGCGAHSHIDGHRWWNEPRFLAYLECYRKGQTVVAGEERLSCQQRLIEAALFGLRTIEGIDLEQLERRYATGLPADKKKLFSVFVTEGFLEKVDGRIRASRKGLPVLDELCARLI